MLSSLNRDSKSFVDLSAELNDEHDWKAGTLRTFEHHLDLTAWAYDPLNGLFAIGTNNGIIELYGAPGVEHRLQLTESVKVTNLQFAVSAFKLVCIDERDRLHVWDLASPLKPKLQHILNVRHPITFMTVSPSHTHVFLALANGEIHTYDLLCVRLSQYKVPNMWALYEEKMLASGMPSTSEVGSQIPIEVVIHPRDLNLLFVAYGGGVAVSDLNQRNTVRAFEYAIPPGAAGGAGWKSANLLTHRRPQVTAIAIHPSGHMFATGHADGSIVFWALEDEDRPLMALTLDGEQDVNIADASRLDDALSGHSGGSGHDAREPIFKLAWSGFPDSSDPRGGETVLTVLGGLRHEEVPGVTSLLLPPLNPPDPPAATTGSTALHPTVRKAMRDATIPKNSHCYSTVGVPQDFLLLAREQPHYSGTWDPHAILLLSDVEQGARASEAYQFPPPLFFPTAHVPDQVSSTEPPDENEDVSKDIMATLQSLQLDDEPKSLSLPPSLWNGPSGVISGNLVNLDRDAYETLLADVVADSDDALQLRGGSAWVADDEGEMKLMKFQAHRVLITHHTDLTVRFRDLSAQLLISSDTAPLQASFPNPLPALTIDLLSVLADPSVSTRTSAKLVEEARIVSSQLAPQSLECAVVLHSGEVAVFRQRAGAPGEHAVQKQLDDEELISTAHVPIPAEQRFQPAFLVIADRGPVSAIALSDIGFIAVAYQDTSFLIVDMRGPRIIYRSTSDGRRRSLLHRNEPDQIQVLTWAVVGTEADPLPRVRLLTTRNSGATSIYALLRAPDGDWAVNNGVETTEGISHPIPQASFVINSRNGSKLSANRSGLGAALTVSPEDTVKGSSFWITAGAKGAKCVVDVTGERIGRAEWPSKEGKVERVVVVRKNASTVLVAHTDKREALVYSIPNLEHMHSLQLNQNSSEPLSVDETGDYVEWRRHPCGTIYAEKYGTIFNIRRSTPYEPAEVDFTYRRKPVPAQPQPVSLGPASIFSSVMGYLTSQSMTGDQIDALLAGPDRPIPQPKEPRPKAPNQAGSSDSRASSDGGTSVQRMANAASRGTGDLYSRLNNALAERGEMLGSLEDSFQSLESGSKKMLSQAKNLAAKQTAKRWFQFS